MKVLFPKELPAVGKHITRIGERKALDIGCMDGVDCHKELALEEMAPKEDNKSHCLLRIESTS
jgi:hypothetical protein